MTPPTDSADRPDSVGPPSVATSAGPSESTNAAGGADSGSTAADTDSGGLSGAEREARRAELSAALTEVRERIAAACAAAGRDAAEVRLLAVTKTFPAADAALLAELGATDLAENRDQEAGPKAAAVADLLAEPLRERVRWHMVGRLQRNKARSVVRWAAQVQSVDSVRLATALARAVDNARERGERSEPLDVLVQAVLDDAPDRGGCPLDELDALAAHVAGLPALRLRGVMAVAPLTTDPGEPFDRLAAAAQRLRAEHPDATELSAGMSGDLEAAVARGSTCVRVGTALLGGRGLASPQGSHRE